jgi:hypothetical protein
VYPICELRKAGKTIHEVTRNREIIRVISWMFFSKEDSKASTSRGLQFGCGDE